MRYILEAMQSTLRNNTTTSTHVRHPKRCYFDKTIMSSMQPQLQWGETDNQGITASGWKPRERGHVFFKDESATKGKITLIIEPPTPGTAVSFSLLVCDQYLPMRCPTNVSRSVAHGYFFEKNAVTGKIDMIHRAKPFRGKEERNAYRDCTYFDITDERLKDDNSDHVLEDCMFTLTSGYSDKLFPTGVNFSPLSCDDFSVIVGAVNSFIHSVQGDVDIDANARVYPLFCTGLEYENQCREFGASGFQYRHTYNETDSITSDSFDASPYYLKASEVRIIGYSDGTQTCQGLSERPLEASVEATAVCVDSLPVVVLARV